MRDSFKRIVKFVTQEYSLLTMILILGFLLRLYKIDNPVADWHSWRQADTASVSRIYMDDGIDLLHPRYYDISTAQSGMFNPEGWRMVEFPVFNLFHTVFASNFNFISFVTWGRLISVFSAVITAVFLYLIGKIIANKHLGLLAAFFYLLIPYNIFFTRVILPEPMSVMFAVISVWSGLKYINKNETRLLYLSAVNLALAVLIKPYSIFLYTPIVYLIIKKEGLKPLFKIKKYYFAGLIAILPFILWRVWISQYPEGIPFWKWAFNEDGIRFKPAFWRWIFGERISRMILGTWGIVLLAVGLMQGKRDKFINLFIFGALLFVTIVATANVKHDYYQTFIIPAISLGLAQGTLTLWNNKDYDKLISRGIVVFSIFMMLSCGAYHIKDFYKINHYEIIEAGNKVQEITSEEDLVIAPYNGDTAFLYQTNRFGWPVVDRSIPELVDKGADYYVSVNYDKLTRQLMEDHHVVYQDDKFVVIKL